MTGELVDAPDDAALWGAVRAGDATAFVAVFHRHGDRVYNHLHRRTGSWSDAEDLTAAVFLVAWQRRGDSFAGGDAALLPWLLTVATRVAQNSERSRRRYERAVSRVSLQRGHTDHAEDAAGRVDAAREVAGLQAALESLPVHEREALEVVSSHGTTTDAAAHLGIPTGTLASRLSRARARLRAAGVGSVEKSGQEIREDQP